jgi:hypothetical protein
VKRLLDRIERPRLGLGQIAREIVQECRFAQPPFVTVINDAGRGWRRRELPGEG